MRPYLSPQYPTGYSKSACYGDMLWRSFWLNNDVKSNIYVRIATSW